MLDNTYTPRDWLLLFGMSMLLLSWWVSFRMARGRDSESSHGVGA